MRPRIRRPGQHPGERHAEHHREQRWPASPRPATAAAPARPPGCGERRAQRPTTARGPAGRPAAARGRRRRRRPGRAAAAGRPRAARRAPRSAAPGSRRPRAPAARRRRARGRRTPAPRRGSAPPSRAQIGYSLIACSASGNSMPSTSAPAALHVGGVDERGVDLAELHLGERRPDVLLLGVGHRGDARRLEDLRRRRAARHVGRADGEGQVRVREVGQPGDVARVALRDGDLQDVLGEDRAGRSACSPASVTTFICVWFAEANTSAGAPWVIWVASAELPAKLNRTSRSGLSAISWSPRSVKTSVSDAAAKTVSVPVSSPRRRLRRRGRPTTPESVAPPASHRSAASASSATRRTRHAPITQARIVRSAADVRVCARPAESIRTCGAQGTSTLTWVAFTVATARTPDLEAQLVGRLPGHQRDQRGTGRPGSPPGPSRCRGRRG